jgi:hypothetical protein
MVDTDLITILADKLGYNHERYVELVRARAQKHFPDKSDELALLRKEVALLKGVLETLLGAPLPRTKFDEYNALMEGIKQTTKAETHYSGE